MNDIINLQSLPGSNMAEDREHLTTMPEDGGTNSKVIRAAPYIIIGIFALTLITGICATVGAWKSSDIRVTINYPPPSNGSSDPIKVQIDPIVVQLDGDTKVKVDGTIEVKVDGKSNNTDNPTCPQVKDVEKFDCHPEPNANQARCLARGCCWVAGIVQEIPVNKEAPVGLPWCFYPAQYSGYELVSKMDTEEGMVAKLRRKTPSGFPLDIQEVQVKINFNDENMVNIKISDPNTMRYEVPFPKLRPSLKGRKHQRNYEILLDESANLVVLRKDTRTRIFDASLSTMIFADQLLQINIKVPFHGFYGIGESEDELLRGHDWKRYVMFNRDRQPEEGLNLYGSHAYYLQMENDGDTHGVFLFNSNAMDIVTQPTPGITFRPIGGILDFFVFLGPTPADVTRQYTKLIGNPIMPPYWSLGFHLCRWGYWSTAETRKVWKRTRVAGIPFDVQWNDIDYMDKYNDFTVNDNATGFAKLGEFVDEIHSVGMHYVMIMDVGVGGSDVRYPYPPYTDGVDMDIFVKTSAGEILVGQVWNDGVTVFPDYTHPRAGEYMTKQYEYLHKKLHFDGAWIDMNEPSNFVDGSKDGCPDNTLENPPYVPGSMEPLRSKTICMSSQQYASTHYNLHNIHGFTNAIATNIALKNVLEKRPFIISRSTAPGQGFYSGHWDGDIVSSYAHLKWTIPSILNFGMFGFSMMGADICGFTGNTWEHLCARWQALGAFYPFSRNHNTNGTKDQDPASFGINSIVVTATKNALKARYSLLPFLYTLFYKAHVDGDTVARALFFEYPKDKNTYTVDTTFLWGPALMIIPVLEENVTQVTAYIPDDVWYDFVTLKRVDKVGANVTFDAKIDHITGIPLLVRGGYILPMQEPGLTTTESRKNPFSLMVALNDGKANGELYRDDGEKLDAYELKQYTLIKFNVENNKLTSELLRSGYSPKDDTPLNTVKVLGVEKPTKVFLDNKEVDVRQWTYRTEAKALTINDLKRSLSSNFALNWS